jgi:SpoIIAA-like
MIEQLTDFPANVTAFACKGHVTRSDYESVLVPAVEAALKQHDKVRLYYQINSDFAGIDSGAMWEDFKIGMEHLLRWERVAVVTDVDWIRYTVQAFGFLMPGAVRVFPLADAPKARAWIVAADAP